MTKTFMMMTAVMVLASAGGVCGESTNRQPAVAKINVPNGRSGQTVHLSKKAPTNKEKEFESLSSEADN